MGVRQSCPSDALDDVWIDDKDAPKCFNCGTDFTMRRRRHHCRCCGGIFCVACWGEQVTLEEAYGFPGPVPICTICSEVFKPDGNMFLLRKGITVAQTHESRSSVTSDSQVPPLANANIRARKFKTNLITLFHWRPFTKRTKLQLTKTKSSKEILRAARTAGLTPRGESALSGRESSVGSNPAIRDSLLNSQVTGGEDAWTIDLDSVESIQLLSFDEKDGGEFICITTGMEEHRIQAVKVRFEEVYIPPVAVKDKLNDDDDENNNNNENSSNSRAIPIPAQMQDRLDGGGVSPQQQSLSARGSMRNSLVPIPGSMRTRSSSAMNNNNNNNGGESLLSGPQSSLRRRGNSMRAMANNGGGSISARGSMIDQNKQVQFAGENGNNNNTQIDSSNTGIDSNNNNNNNNNGLLNDDPNTDNSPGGEKCSASDRRSMVSSGTRLRTVMLDKNGTRALYSSLLRAHQVCQKRAQFVPACVKCAVEVDLPEDEVTIGSNPTTPRIMGGNTRQSAPNYGSSLANGNSHHHPMYQDSATVASSEEYSKVVAVEKIARARAYSMA